MPAPGLESTEITSEIGLEVIFLKSLRSPANNRHRLFTDTLVMSLINSEMSNARGRGTVNLNDLNAS